MCGIAGCYQQADGHKLVDIMTDRIEHRGPDATGNWSYEDDRAIVNLGHLRLSIIDLSAAANQPFSKDGLTLAYNGELYNYKEIRAEPGRPRCAFLHTVRYRGRARGLAGLGTRGPAPVPRNVRVRPGGRASTGDLVLARDPLGIKPLYLLPRGNGVIFASELKALLAAVGTELRINPAAMVASMLYYWVPDQQCSIEGVQKLPPGSWARVRPDGAFSVHHYWRIADVALEAAAGPAADLAAVIEESVDGAPRVRRARVELPVGRTGFKHHHRAGASARPGHRRLHDHLPA